MTLRFACVDIGTNAVQTLVAEIRGRDDFQVLDVQAVITRLGEGVDASGLLAQSAMSRTLAELDAARGRLAAEGVSEVVIVGTSALRDAENRAEFEQRVGAETGWSLRILSEREEASYSFRAASAGLGLGERPALVIDVGGGSTEFIWGVAGEPADWVSLPLGSVRLTERLIRSNPVSDGDYQRVVERIDAELSTLQAPIAADVVVGMAGTFTTLVAVERGLEPYAAEQVHGARLAWTEVSRQVQEYRRFSVAARSKIRGLDPRRADVILVGALIVERAMTRFGFDEALISDYGLNYGILAERAALVDV